MSAKLLRSVAAWVLLAVFVVSTSVGAFIYDVSLGFVVLGLSSGIAAYLIGSDSE